MPTLGYPIDLYLSWSRILFYFFCRHSTTLSHRVCIIIGSMKSSQRRDGEFHDPGRGMDEPRAHTRRKQSTGGTATEETRHPTGIGPPHGNGPSRISLSVELQRWIGQPTVRRGWESEQPVGRVAIMDGWEGCPRVGELRHTPTCRSDASSFVSAGLAQPVSQKHPTVRRFSQFSRPSSSE